MVENRLNRTDFRSIMMWQGRERLDFAIIQIKAQLSDFDARFLKNSVSFNTQLSSLAAAANNVAWKMSDEIQLFCSGDLHDFDLS